MKFRIETVWYGDASHILQKYPTIKDFNIEIVNDAVYVTLDNLQDLMKFSEKYGEIIVRSKNSPCEEEDVIEIYDDYRE